MSESGNCLLKGCRAPPAATGREQSALIVLRDRLWAANAALREAHAANGNPSRNDRGSGKTFRTSVLFSQVSGKYAVDTS
ncbi:MAG TPA: hypothetical protein VFE79_23125 [Paraburkholderia sp.]|nr:hypothetical protein [Paraburkholderia sp.]